MSDNLNFEELSKRLDDYFKNNTKEQILKDLEEAGCLEYCEDVSSEKVDDENTKIEKS